MLGYASDDPADMFDGLDWLKPLADTGKGTGQTASFALQPLSSNIPTTTAAASAATKFKRKTAATSLQLPARQPGAVGAVFASKRASEQGRQQQQQASNQRLLAQPKLTLPAFTTKPAADSPALPSLKALSTSSQLHANRTSTQHSSSPAQPSAPIPSMFDFLPGDSEDDDMQQESPAAAKLPSLFSKLQGKPCSTAANTQASKQTAQQPQQGRFQLPQLFSSRGPAQQRQQNAAASSDSAAAGHARKGPSLQLAPLKSFSRSSKQTSNTATKLSTAQHDPSSCGGPLLPLVKPAAAAGAAAADAGGQSSSKLGPLAAFNITSATGELEFIMESQDPVAHATAAPTAADAGADSAGMSHDDSAGVSQGSEGTSSEGAGVQQEASSSYGDSGSGSDADVAATASSGSLWSGSGSGSSSGSEGAGSDSDGSYVCEGRSGKHEASKGRRAGIGGSSRAAGAKHLLQLQGRKRAAVAERLEDDAAGPGSKRQKQVRFAGDPECKLQQQQQQQEGLLHDALGLIKGVKAAGSRAKGGSKAAGCAAVLDLEVAVPGEVPLLLQSANSMMRGNVILVELPAGFDAEGDAGAIGRVVCSTAGQAVSDSHAVARVADRPKQQPAARRCKASAAAAATAGKGDSSSSADEASGSETQSESEVGSDVSSLGDGQGGEDDEVLTQDDAGPAGAPALDLKGMVYDIRELLLAGTAAVVRINAPGKGTAGKPASAHVEHLLTSFCSATPAAAAAAAAAEQDCDAGFEFEWEACDDEPHHPQDAAGCAGDGGGGGDDIGAMGSKGKGRKGTGISKKSRGPAAAGVTKKARAKPAAAGKRGSKGGAKQGKGKGRGAGAGKGRAVGAASLGKQAAGVCGGKASGVSSAAGGGKSSKKAAREPWETDSDDSE